MTGGTGSLSQGIEERAADADAASIFLDGDAQLGHWRALAVTQERLV